MIKQASAFILKLKEDQYRFYFLLLLSVVTLPINININALFISIFVLNGLVSIKKTDFEKNNSIKLLYFLYILFFVFNLISLLYTDNIDSGISKIQTKLSFLLIPVVYFLGLSKISTVQIQKIKRVFISVIILSLVFCYVESATTAFMTQNFKEFEDSHLSNPLMHRGYLSILIGIAILFFWKDKEFLKKYRIIVFLLFAITLILLQGRINILAFTLVVLGYLLFQAFKYKKWKILGYLFIALSASVILFKVIPKEHNRFNQPLNLDYDISTSKSGDFTGITIRIAIWDQAIPLIKENLLVGKGIGDYMESLSNQYTKNKFVKGISNKFNCHNQYLESSLAAGILTSAILIVILIVYILNGIKSKDSFIIMVSVFFFLSMLTESVLERHWGITPFCILLPLLFKENLLKR